MMEETHTYLVLWYASGDTLDVYEIEGFICKWKTFEAVRVKDKSGIRDGCVNLQIGLDPAYSFQKVLVSGETDKVRVERNDIEACKLLAVLGSHRE
jgi:hypothetical protein